ncbi:MAG: hypothetical protein ACTH6A_04080 [Brachybacterium tyrofermentans]|uniref:hypothetical protein n=1 Tax=Brachybacterium tyrofermentans TaxID=47848 RepID=UPI003F8F2EE8
MALRIDRSSGFLLVVQVHERVEATINCPLSDSFDEKASTSGSTVGNGSAIIQLGVRPTGDMPGPALVLPIAPPNSRHLK